MPLNTAWIDLAKPWTVFAGCWHHENLPLILCAAVILFWVWSVQFWATCTCICVSSFHSSERWSSVIWCRHLYPGPVHAAGSQQLSSVCALQGVNLLFQIPKTWTGSRSCGRGRAEASAEMATAASTWWGKSVITFHFWSPLCVGHQNCSIWEVKLGSPARCHCRLEHMYR